MDLQVVTYLYWIFIEQLHACSFMALYFFFRGIINVASNSGGIPTIPIIPIIVAT